MLLKTKQPKFMKRSKIFLGLTTGLLAIAALAAKKAYTPTINAYISGPTGLCTHFVAIGTTLLDASEPITPVGYFYRLAPCSKLLYESE